ncbi:MAG: rRNA maturation RNase YbeY [Elusimicrobia bacterium]|nr:rRNA maturation RNase YbeY [Elusimicrobiota bacterium]
MILSYNCPEEYFLPKQAEKLAGYILKNFWRHPVPFPKNPILDIETVDGPEIQRINREYLGRDNRTDVIAFSFIEGEPSPIGEEICHLGQILISKEAVSKQAQAEGHSEKEEFRLLLVHGLLHIAGLEEGEELEDCQIKILNRLSQII